MSGSLSIVIPVYNEASELRRTLQALVRALEPTAFEADVVVVDDGSTDGSADVARSTLDGRLRATIVSQPNRGRFEARRAGLESAQGEWVLVLDSRVRLAADALVYVEPRLAAGESVWNGHVHVRDDGGPWGTFWKLLAELAWKDYFTEPRETSFGSEDFDRFPKGLGCFLAPRELLIGALTNFHTRFEDTRRSNDDTPVIRWIAAKKRIHISPGFACEYIPRTTLRGFLRHALHRGVVFFDGHGRRSSGFFPAVVAFYPVSAASAILALRRPLRVLPLAAAAIAVAGAAVALSRGRSPRETRAFATVLPAYSAAHGAGMWLGLLLAVRDRLRRGAPA
jgi:glycosyltransferase involved in cell wall biosynthesis